MVFVLCALQSINAQEYRTYGRARFQVLSSPESANSYIVSEPGFYTLETVKGNSSESVGRVVSAAVLWESFGTSTTPRVGDLIKKVAYNNGYLYFQTADTFREGNAVIVASDAFGDILWSWHIWFTDKPQGQIYYNGAGTMMDRNLGATCAIPGDVGALGLFYQWGRKDPFLGSSSISDEVFAKSTISWPSAVPSSSRTGTISYTISNPTTFISHGTDWYYGSVGDRRWTESIYDKSIYDPCPAGWRVPDGGEDGIWSKACSLNSLFNCPFSSSTLGYNFSRTLGSATTIWYPITGFLDDTDGNLLYVGAGGGCWSASPINNQAYFFCFNDDGEVNPSNDNSRAIGRSVRCIKE